MADKRKGRTYETELPAGYEETMRVDVKDKRLMLFLNLIAIIVTAIGIAAAAMIIFKEGFVLKLDLITPIVFSASIIAYVVLHELVHGLASKLMTGQRLKFGFTGGAAYCSIPGVYLYRRTNTVSLLAPLVVFGALFLALALFLTAQWHRFLAAAMLSFHIGSCVGDLYMLYLFFTRFKDDRTLTLDTIEGGSVSAVYYLPKSHGE